jgi:ribonuclease T1
MDRGGVGVARAAVRMLAHGLGLGVLACLVALLFAAAPAATDVSAAPPELAETTLGELPREARQTLELIDRGGPFPYARDGVVFGNFERLLPVRERGYYREYTVRTPGVKHRGARRIVAGKGGERYYTDDHYKSFKRIKK